MPRLRVPLALALLVAVTSVVLSCGDPPSAAPRTGSIVWAVGDGGNGSDQARTLERVIARDNPRRVLYLGDVYEHGTATDFRKRFGTVYGPLAARMDPTPGNHDWPNHATGYDPYWRKIRGRPLAHHYAFSLGGWRIVSLNSETPDNAAQLRFLRRQVKGRRCVLASCTARASTPACTTTRSATWRSSGRRCAAAPAPALRPRPQPPALQARRRDDPARDRRRRPRALRGQRRRPPARVLERPRGRRAADAAAARSRAPAHRRGPTAASWTAPRSVADYGCSTILIAPSCFFWNVS